MNSRTFDDKWSQHKRLIGSAENEQAFNDERAQLEEKLLDAANALMHHMGCGSLRVSSRMDNGTMLVVGDTDAILRLVGVEVAGTVDVPCSPAWFARIECKPEVNLAKGETLYRKRSHV